MLHIFLFILKIIGICILVLLSLLVFLTLLVLFVPIKYKISVDAIEKEQRQNFEVKTKAHFLGVLLMFSGEYKDDFKWRLRLFGIKIKSSEKKYEKLKKMPHKNTVKQSDINNDNTLKENNYKTKKAFEEHENKNRLEKEIDGINKKSHDDKTDDNSNNNMTFLQKIKNIPAKIKHIFLNIRSTINGIVGFLKKINSFINDEQFMYSLSFIKRKVFFCIKKYLPKIGKTELVFGTEDPALTGKLYGAIWAFKGFSGQDFIIAPDFESDKLYLKGQANFKGKIRLFHLVKLIYYYIFNKNVKYFKQKVFK